MDFCIQAKKPVHLRFKVSSDFNNSADEEHGGMVAHGHFSGYPGNPARKKCVNH